MSIMYVFYINIKILYIISAGCITISTSPDKNNIAEYRISNIKHII